MTLKVEAVLKIKTEWEATKLHVVLEGERLVEKSQ